MNNKLRFGIVGAAGTVGETNVKAVVACSQAQLAGVTDLDLEKCADIAGRHRARMFSSFEEMIHSDLVDAVGIATPHPLHRDMAVAALRAGKHVLVEKPLAVTVREADEMIAVSRECGRFLGVILQQRFRPIMLKAREMIGREILGPLYRTNLVFSSYKTDGYYQSGGWRGTWRGEGGGVLYNQAPHLMDVFIWLGGMPSKVCAWTRTLSHQIDVEDIASALLEYPNGAQGMLHCNTVQMPGQNLMEFFGDRGRLALDDETLIWDRFEMPLRSHQAGAPGAGKSVRVERQSWTFPLDPPSHEAVYAAFTANLLRGEQPPVSAPEASQSLELANAITLSSFRKREVSLPLDRAEYQALFEDLKNRTSRKIASGNKSKASPPVLSRSLAAI